VLVIAAQAQPPAASVSGRVVDGATGQSVPGMVVAVVGTDRKTAGDALTDVNGRYEITGLAPGAYAIGVSHDEHRSTYLRQWYGESFPSATFVPPRFAVTLAAGERRRDADVALTRALAIEGVVLDPLGDPVTQVEVTVTRAAGGLAGVNSAHTDDRGAYRIYGLPPGRYRVCVRPSGDWTFGDSVVLVRTCYPGALGEPYASDVTLASQDAAGIDIRLQLIGGRSISGTVVDAGGSPADDAFVTVMPFDDSSRGGSARTQNGAFSLEPLAPGRYLVAASIGGSRAGDVDPPSREKEMAYVPVDLTASDASLALTLAKGVTLAGTLTFEGKAPPRSARSRISVEARVLGELQPWPSLQPASAIVSDDFSFALPDLFGLPQHIVVRGLPDGWVLKSVHYGERDITDAPTDFTAAPTARLQLVVTDRVASPSVEVVNERGENVPAAHGMAMPADPARWTMANVRIPQLPPTGAAARLGAMLPGKYLFVALSIDDYLVLMRNPSRLPSVAGLATSVTLEPGDTRVVTLRVVPLPDK
jgi:hypothetical protein